MPDLSILNSGIDYGEGYKPTFGNRAEWLANGVAQFYKSGNASDKMFVDAQQGISPADRKQDTLDEQNAAAAADLVGKTIQYDDSEFQGIMDQLHSELGTRPGLPVRENVKPNPVASIISALASFADPARGAKYAGMPFAAASAESDRRYNDAMLARNDHMQARNERIGVLQDQAGAAQRKAQEEYRAKWDAEMARQKMAFDAEKDRLNREERRAKAEELYRSGMMRLYGTANTADEKETWGNILVELGIKDPQSVQAEVERMRTAEASAQTGKDLGNQKTQQAIDQKAQEFAWKAEDRPAKRKLLEDSLVKSGLGIKTAQQLVKKNEIALEFMRPEIEAKIETMKRHLRQSTPEQLQKDLSRKDSAIVYRAARSGIEGITKDLRKIESEYETMRAQWFEIDKKPAGDLYAPNDTRTNGEVSATLRRMLEQKKSDIAALKADIARRSKVIFAWESKNVSPDMQLGYQPMVVGAPNTMSGQIGR